MELILVVYWKFLELLALILSAPVTGLAKLVYLFWKVP
jgi:hypothetical protein